MHDTGSKFRAKKINFHRHNDLPFALREYYDNQFDEFDLTVNGSVNPPGLGWHTDIPRLRAGKVGGQVKFTFGAMNRSCMSKLVTDFFLMHSFGLPTWAAQLKDLTLQEPLWTRLMSSNYSSKSTQTHSSLQPVPAILPQL